MKACQTKDCPEHLRVYSARRFCVSCGKHLAYAPECSGCGMPLEQAQQRYCGYCGAEVLKKG